MRTPDRESVYGSLALVFMVLMFFFASAYLRTRADFALAEQRSAQAQLETASQCLQLLDYARST